MAKMKEKKEESLETTPAEDSTSELFEPRWSVITFDETAASGLKYDEAFELRTKLENEKISGLCIITDEAAARLKAEKK